MPPTAAAAALLLAWAALAACGAGQATTDCGLGGVSHAPEAVALAYSCKLDLGGRRTNGDVFVLGDGGGQSRRLTSGYAWDFDPAWSPDRGRIVFSSTRSGAPNLYSMDAGGGQVRRITAAVSWESAPAWSPDGRGVVFESGRDGLSGPLGVARRHRAIFRVAAAGGSPVRLTSADGYSGDPAWSPDGARIAFVSDRDGGLDLYVMASDGSGVRRLTHGGADGRPSWSPDGARIAFHRSPAPDALSQARIHVVNADGSGDRVLFDGSGYQPAWSPDGRWIAYVGDGDGYPNLYVARPEGGETVQLTHDRAPKFRPAWRPA